MSEYSFKNMSDEELNVWYNQHYQHDSFGSRPIDKAALADLQRRRENRESEKRKNQQHDRIISRLALAIALTSLIWQIVKELI